MQSTAPRWRLLAAGAALAVLAAWAFFASRNDADSTPLGPNRSGPPPIPVRIAVAAPAEVPHLSNAIGTITALNTVVIRPRRDGVLQEVRFREGATVRRGELLAAMDDRSEAAALANAKAETLRAEAELKAARADLARYQSVVADGAISRQQLEQQDALVGQLEAAVAARAAAVDVAAVSVDDTRIVAPITGRAGIRRVDPGNLIRVSDAEGLVTLTQMDPIGVEFALPQALLAEIGNWTAGEDDVDVQAFDQLGGTALATGRIVTVDNAVDPTTGTLRIKAEFPNKAGRLWPGQFVTIRVQTGRSDSGLVVPSEALQRGRDQLFVYREKDGRVDAVPVTVEYDNETHAVIATGLTAGDRIVTDGQSRLRPGSAVTVLADEARVSAKQADPP